MSATVHPEFQSATAHKSTQQGKTQQIYVSLQTSISSIPYGKILRGRHEQMSNYKEKPKKMLLLQPDCFDLRTVCLLKAKKVLITQAFLFKSLDFQYKNLRKERRMNICAMGRNHFSSSFAGTPFLSKEK